MIKLADKSQFIEAIKVSRRQLDRYLFFFEKDSSSEFVAGEQFKYSEEEAAAPGHAGSWSLYQVLAQVHAAEQAFLQARLAGSHAPGGLSQVGLTSMAKTFNELTDAPEVQPLPAFLQQYRASHQEILSYIAGLPEEALFASQPTRLAGEVLEATCQRYDWAKQQIRRWQRAHSGQQMNQALLLKRIDSERRRLEKTLARLEPSQKTQPGVIGLWSVKDILAHLAAWEQLFLGWYQAGLRGETPQVPAPGFTWHEMDELNEQIYQQHRLRSLAEVQEWFASSYLQVCQVIQEIPESDLFEPGRYPWQGKSSLLQYVLANTANHYRWANSKVRAWLR